MADQDMDLLLRITGDSTSAVSAVQQTTAAMDKVPQSVNVSQASLDRLSQALDGIVKQHGLVSDSAGKAEDGIKKVSSATSEASKAGGEINSVYGDMARAFSSVGIQSGEAASRVGALAGALESLKTAAPAIIGLVTGAVAGVSGFEFIKNAVTSASDLQNAMTRLGQVVKDQGGNWTLLSRQVQDFTDAQIRSTTYTDTAVINSIERLVASGMSVKDAMTSTRIAEDLAAGSGRSLEEATYSLIEATHGRLMGLEAEGVLTKEQVKTGLTYDQVLQQIEEHMGGAASAATATYSGSLAALGAVWQKLLEDAGTPFLGLLTSVVRDIGGVVESIDGKMQPAFKSISDWATSQIPVVKQWFDQLKDTIDFLGHEMRSVAGPDGAGALEGALTELHHDLDQVEASLDHGKTGWEFTRDIIKQTADAAHALASVLDDVDSRLNSALEIQNRFASAMHSFWGNFFPSSSQQLAAMGYSTGVGGSASFAHPLGAGATASQGGPLQWLGLGSGSGTAQVGPTIAAAAELSKKAAESSANAAASSAHTAAAAQASTSTSYDPYIGGSTGRSAGAGRGGSSKTPDGHGSATITDPLAGIIPSIEQTQSFLDKFWGTLGTDDMTATQKMNSDWAEFVNQSGDKMNEDLHTFTETNQQKADYYWNTLERMVQDDTGTLEERKQLYTNYIQAVEAEDRELYQKEQQFENTAASKMASFLDTIIVEHKSMASALKSVYQDIEKWFLDMLARMLAQALIDMPIFQRILAMLGLGGGTGGGIDTSFITPGSGVFAPPPGMGGNIGGGGSAPKPPATAPLLSSPAIAAAMNTAMSQSGGGGSVGSGSYGSYGGGGATMPDVGGGGYGGGSGGGSIFTPQGPAATSISPYLPPSMQNTASSPLGLTQMLGTLLKGAAGKVMLGLGLGDMGAALTGGNSIWGMLGGGLGAGIGLLLHANPLIGAGIDILMGIIGGMFGNHFNPANEPDINNPEWGQANADMQGMTAANPMNANGKQFVMDSQTAQATGGKGWNILFEKFVQQYRGNVNTLPYTLQAAFPEIEQLWGGATDKQYFNPDGKDGYLDIGSGKRALWSDFWGDVQKYGSQVSQLMQGDNAISMYVTSANQSMQSIGSGTKTPGGNNPFMLHSPGSGGGGTGSNAIASGGPGRLGASLAEQLARSINVNLNIHNSSTLIDNTNLARSVRDLVVMPMASVLEDLNGR